MSTGLDTLSEDLERDVIKRLLKSILPILESRKVELQQDLLKQDWINAAKHAHRLRGSVRQYGSPELDAYLLEIQQKNLLKIRQGEFLEEFMHQFEKDLQAIRLQLYRFSLR